jgi:hypothetical protein
VRVRVRIKSDDAFGLLRERVSSQNSQQNFFQFVLSLQSPHEKCVASLNESSPRHRRTRKNAKSSLLREEEEEKGAGRGTKKKKICPESVLCHVRLKERTIFSLSLVLIFSLSKQRAPKKKKENASLWWCDDDDDVVVVVNGATAEARSHLLK